MRFLLVKSGWESSEVFVQAASRCSRDSTYPPCCLGPAGAALAEIAQGRRALEFISFKFEAIKLVFVG